MTRSVLICLLLLSLLMSACGTAPSMPAGEPSASSPADTPAPAATPVPPSPTPQGSDFIAFISDQDGTYEIYIHDLAAGTTVRLTSSGRMKTSLTPSPDGTRLAYVEGELYTQRVYVVDLRGSGQAVAVSPETGSAQHPAWSPDGQSVAFAYAAEPGGLTGIGYAPAAGGAYQPVTATGGREEHPAWSPDGLYLYHTHRDSEGALGGVPVLGFPSIYRTPAAGGPSQAWVDLEGLQESFPVALPGGFVFLALPSAGLEGAGLYSLADGAAQPVLEVSLTEAMVSAFPLVLWTAAASPDGTRLAFILHDDAFDQARMTRGSLYLAGHGGGEPQLLAELGMGIITPPAWSPDGSRLIYATGDPNSRLMVLDLQTGELTALNTGPGNAYAPAWFRLP